MEDNCHYIQEGMVRCFVFGYESYTLKNCNLTNVTTTRRLTGFLARLG